VVAVSGVVAAVVMTRLRRLQVVPHLVRRRPHVHVRPARPARRRSTPRGEDVRRGRPPPDRRRATCGPACRLAVGAPRRCTSRWPSRARWPIRGARPALAPTARGTGRSSCDWPAAAASGGRAGVGRRRRRPDAAHRPGRRRGAGLPRRRRRGGAAAVPPAPDRRPPRPPRPRAPGGVRRTVVDRDRG
jgi:hypothetical protein